MKANSTPVKLGGNISVSEEISVSKKSCADFQILNMSEDIVIRLKENTVFKLKEQLLKNVTTKTLLVNSGEAFFNINKLKTNENLKIVTPTIVLAVRGTYFGVSIEPNTGVSKVALYEGSVSVTPSLIELEELGDDIFQSAGISSQIEEWKQKTELILEPGQSLEVNPKITKEFLKKIGWDEIIAKPEVKDFLNKKAKSSLTDEDKNKIKSTLKSYYEDPKNKERVNAVLSEGKISFPVKAIPSAELNSKLEELQELVAVEKEKLEKSTDKNLPVKERSNAMRNQLMKRIAEITNADVGTLNLKNGKTIQGAVLQLGDNYIVTTPDEIMTIPLDQVEDVSY